MRYIGINPVIVHGGGPEINDQLAKDGVASKFIDGLRVTDKETMKIAQMVLVGKINQELRRIDRQIRRQGRRTKRRRRRYD